MYIDALSFLEDEREAWTPYEALGELPDEALERAMPADGPTHGWRGRDLVAHVVGWQQVALGIARELAIGETSATLDRANADWDARGPDAINAAMLAEWADLPLDEVRHRLATVAGELRGYLTVVPETRWVKRPATMSFLLECTLDHYAEHMPELEAVVGGVGVARGG